MIRNLPLSTWLLMLVVSSPVVAQSPIESTARDENPIFGQSDESDIDRLQAENELRYHNMAQPLGCLLQSREESLELRLERIERLLASPEVQSALVHARRSRTQPLSPAAALPNPIPSKAMLGTEGAVEVPTGPGSPLDDGPDAAIDPLIAEPVMSLDAESVEQPPEETVDKPTIVQASATNEELESIVTGPDWPQSELWQAVCDLEQACSRLRTILESLPPARE